LRKEINGRLQYLLAAFVAGHPANWVTFEKVFDQ
jgi:hypothetical protein